MKGLNRLGQVCLIFSLLLYAGQAQATDISGTITTTFTIFEDSQLVGNVTCQVVNAPCISFGAPGITLRLKGFTITGRAEPPTNCATPSTFVPEDGISAINQSNVSIIGPGLIQKFRRHGIFLNGNPAMNTATGITVRRITSNTNCFSGVQMSGVTSSELIESVSVRNAIASEQLPCGGNCITNSHNNTIIRNVFSGNGSVSGSSGNNDFGVGLVGNSSGNLLRENAIGGNTNGILIQAAASGNIIRRNIIAGNPPVQVSATFGATIGFDIRDSSPAGANTFDENLCLTYSGATAPAPCPNIPKFAGHHNAPPGFSQKP
jgi:parallel beta-helix repeat protein